MTATDTPTSSPTPEASPPNEISVAETASPTVNSEETAQTEPQLEASSAGATEGSPDASEAVTDESADAAGDDDGDQEGEESSADGEPAKAEGGEGAPKKKKRRRKKKRKDDKPAADQAQAQAQQAQQGSKKSHRPPTPFHLGEEVFGKVTAVLDTAIMVDLSGKALAIFDRNEMAPDDLVPSVGDRFVARVHGDGARGGLVVLTRQPLREEESKPKVEAAHKEGALVKGLVTGVIKGGVEVDIDGLRAFAPASGMDLHPSNANFAALVGQRLDFKVVQYEKGGRDVVVTRRPMLEAEAHERRKQALGLLQEGQVLNGVVRTVVDWGVFVALPDAENLEGLIHISEASHDPRAHLADLFKPGDRFEVKIVKIDEKGKIWLSRKALVDDPWGAARQKYQIGSRHRGKVLRVERFGVFVELEPDIEGLIHVSDLSLERIEHPKELVQPDQEIDVVVHYFDVRNKKINLHPAPPPERADEPAQKVQRNALIKAEVVRGEAAGVVMRVLGVTGRQARGFLPASETGTQRGTDLRKAFKPGTVLDVKVVDVDPRSGEPRLSIRAFNTDEERRAHREYRQKLKAEANFGTLGDLLRAKLGQ
jgi:small subunit ribosomal protein S1